MKKYKMKGYILTIRKIGASTICEIETTETSKPASSR